MFLCRNWLQLGVAQARLADALQKDSCVLVPLVPMPTERCDCVTAMPRLGAGQHRQVRAVAMTSATFAEQKAVKQKPTQTQKLLRRRTERETESLRKSVLRHGRGEREVAPYS
ncbi:unnamed protein product [Symbiodinium natans]|uniref:Uncharacterized protein n=1 Tax=Symbiodinium natans TaxID=878477 RepID=A0A812JVA8_9DINO|nr:unnamed protein product [Symbiodinium natans]